MALEETTTMLGPNSPGSAWMLVDEFLPLIEEAVWDLLILVMRRMDRIGEAPHAVADWRWLRRSIRDIANTSIRSLVPYKRLQELGQHKNNSARKPATVKQKPERGAGIHSQPSCYFRHRSRGVLLTDKRCKLYWLLQHHPLRSMSLTTRKRRGRPNLAPGANQLYMQGANA